MTMISLHRPVVSHPDLKRLHFFAGRHLGEDEFDQRQQYVKARLATLLTSENAGVLSGLNLQYRDESGPADEINLIVTPGSGVTPEGIPLTLRSPLQCSWQELLNDYLDKSQANNVAGVYYLTLHQDDASIDPPNADPCQRTAFDPTRDTRLVSMVSLRLQRLSVTQEEVRSKPGKQLQNEICAMRVESVPRYSSSVILGLVAFDDTSDGARLEWVSEAAGRYYAHPDAGYFALQNQTHIALEHLMRRYRDLVSPQSLADFLRNQFTLSYLPAAGRLPLAWLEDIAGDRPSVVGLPAHLGIDIIPVSEDTLDDLIQRHLPRRVIDLKRSAGDRIRLVLPMKRSVYRADILDKPATDARLEQDIFTYCQSAYVRWLAWFEAFRDLYYVSDDVVLDADEKPLNSEDIDELDLPEPTPPPALPAQIFSQLKIAAGKRLGIASQSLPPPYDKEAPEPTKAFDTWAPKDSDGVNTPPSPAERTRYGLLGQYKVTENVLDTLEEKIRKLRTRLERTRDILLLKRQQLDSQTVSLAALAGGVAGDGKGLQVARWLPYATLNTDMVPEETSSAAAKVDSTAVPASTSVKASTTERTSTATELRLAEYKGLTDEQIKRLAIKETSLRTAAEITSPAGKETVFTYSTPDKYSAFEQGINQDRLSRLQAPKAAVSKPAFNTKEFRFGVMDHISPDVSEYNKTFSGMKDLLQTIDDLFSDDDEFKEIRHDLKLNKSESGSEAVEDEDVLKLRSPTQLAEDIDTALNEYLDDNADEEPRREHLRGLFANQKRYEALFTAGKVLTRWISIMESRYNTLENSLQQALRKQQALISRQEKRKVEIIQSRHKLRQLDSIADEALGDYSVAQQLLDEDWQRVFAANNERTRILTTQVESLWYVRVRQTEVSRRLPDPLPLRRDNPDDLVPGCEPDADAELPDALLTFWKTVREIPLSNWKATASLKPRLMAMADGGLIKTMRETRLNNALPLFAANKVTQSFNSGNMALRSTSDSAAFTNMAQQSQKRISRWAAVSVPENLLQVRPATIASVLSLEDIQNHSNRRLRHAGRDLLEKLEQCQICLQDTLAALPGSVRLRWGQLAEDNRLPVEAISRWPGLKLAEESSFITTRTLAELIDWWFRQLIEEADEDSRQTMRDMIRAAVIYASLGNPQEIVRGTISAPPGLFRAGEFFRVALNRQVVPGKVLQLLTHEQEVAAEITVEESDAEGTRVRISKVLRESIEFSANVSVIGRVR